MWKMTMKYFRGHLVPKDEAIPNDTKRSESDE